MSNHNSINIEKNPSADSRTANHLITKDELARSTRSHKRDVERAMKFFIAIMKNKARVHDWTKLAYLTEFYKQFSNAQKTGVWGTGWYDQLHLVRERHHLEKPPADVDLLDVLEEIADGVVAGLARKGSYTMRLPSSELLVNAYKNTARKLLAVCNVDDADEEE